MFRHTAVDTIRLNEGKQHRSTAGHPPPPPPPGGPPPRAWHASLPPKPCLPARSVTYCASSENHTPARGNSLGCARCLLLACFESIHPNTPCRFQADWHTACVPSPHLVSQEGGHEQPPHCDEQAQGHLNGVAHHQVLHQPAPQHCNSNRHTCCATWCILTTFWDFN